MKTLRLLVGMMLCSTCGAEELRPVYLNPVDCVADVEGRRAYVALAGVLKVAVVDLERVAMIDDWPLPLPPSGLAHDRRRGLLAVAMGETAGRVTIVECATGKKQLEFPAGYSPVAPVFLEDGEVLVVCNRFTHCATFFDAKSGRELARVPTNREPIAAVASADGRRLFVGCMLPAQAATADYVAAAVDVIDVPSRKRKASLLLPNGGNGLFAMSASADGKWLFAPHVLGHYQSPTNQLERGWMNANALTVIDMEKETVRGTVLLDDATLGAANPWGVATTADGRFLAVAHAGTHELSRIPLDQLTKVIQEAPATTGYQEGALERDLTTMTRAGRTRIPMEGLGPRVVTAAGNQFLVCEYFGGSLTIVGADGGRPRRIALGKEPPMDVVRQGELRFADARLCFQQWQSCISCHPSVRADALNWDLLNDGLGNPKQTKSMIHSHVTPPAMGHGIRASAEVAVRAGIRFIQFAEVDERQAESIDEYLKSLRPLPSPRLVDGKLNPLAAIGRGIFERIGCRDCHTGPYFTDKESHDVRHATGRDAESPFDTPTLIENWRTGPYLYDGRAATMEEALKIKSKWTKDLTSEEMKALVEYVLSL
jgi:hypothetical protein